MLNFIKKIILPFSLSINLYAAPSAVYIELGAGLGLNDTQNTKNAEYVYDRGYIGSISLGYQADKVRVEIEERYKKDDLYSTSIGNGTSLKVDGDLVSDSQMFNVYYSGYNDSKLISSIGVGAGITSLSIQDSIKDDAILSLQAMFSIGYMIKESFIVTGKYTYFYTQDSSNFKANGDNIMLFSLRYLF
jgi:hypothetical protein